MEKETTATDEEFPVAVVPPAHHAFSHVNGVSWILDLSPHGRWTSVRTSVGRPSDVRTDVRGTSVGRPYGRPYRRPYGRPYGRPTDVRPYRRRTSVQTSVGRPDGCPSDVRTDVHRTSVRTSDGRPDGCPSDVGTDVDPYRRPYSRPLDNGRYSVAIFSEMPLLSKGTAG